MIKREDIVKIGKFNKPHGIKGELTFAFTNDVFDESECRFIICEMDGIFVPFILESYRFKSNDTAFIKLEGIDSEIKAKTFMHSDVYFPKEFVSEEKPEENSTWDYFIGYEVIDETLGSIGKIIEVDETTINILFIVQYEDQERLIPATEDMITTIDTQSKKLYVELPEGIIDL